MTTADHVPLNGNARNGNARFGRRGRRRLAVGSAAGLIALAAFAAPVAAQTSGEAARGMRFAGFAFQLPKGGKWTAERGTTPGTQFLHLRRQKASVNIEIQATTRQPDPPLGGEEELLASVGEVGDGTAVPDRDRGAVCARTNRQWQDEFETASKATGGKAFGTGVYAEMDDHFLVCLHPQRTGKLISFRFVARARVGEALKPHDKAARAFFESVRFSR